MKTLLRRRIMETTMDEDDDVDEVVGNKPSQEPTTSTSTPATPMIIRQHICRACGRSTSVKTPAPVTPQLNNSPSNSNSNGNNNSNKQRHNIPPEQLPVLCDACKKFYCRYRVKIQEETCTCGGNSNGTGDKCRLCRYQRCENAIAERRALTASRPPPPEPEPETPVEKVDFSKLPCAVCGYSSSGFHFGVVSCEGCKGFFRRSMNRTYKIQYTCKGIRDPSGDRSSLGKKLCPSSSNCRKCRLQRCTDAGMSLKEIAIGRHTVRRRAEIDAAIKRHFAQGSFLKSKLCRRKKMAGEGDGEGDGAEQQGEEKPSPSSPSSPENDEQGNSQIADSTTISPFARGNQTKTECLTPVGVSPNGYEDSSPNQFNFMKALQKTAVSAPTPLTDSPSSSTAVTPVAHSSNLVYRFSERENQTLDASIHESSEWLIERAVEASVRLAGISAVRIVLNYQMTIHEMVSERVRSLDTYVKHISEFITVLPGINQISMSDRILLFTQGFFPITAAQLSLNFDVELQIPNHLSLDRDGPAWEIWAKEIPVGHMAIENFLIEAGNRLITAIGNLQEFSLFCALVLLNPDTPSLENVETVRAVRRRYELALFHYFSKTSGVRSEQRLGEIYQLFPFFRRSTTLFHDFFADIGRNRPNDRVVWTPLFKQFHAQIVSLPTSCANPAEALRQ